MSKSTVLARATLIASAALTVPVAPALAAGTITVDRTIEQQCSYTWGAVGTPEGPRNISLPIRIQFTVPETLDRGDTLSLDQRRVSLPSPGALLQVIDASEPEDVEQTFLSASGSKFGGGAAISVTGLPEPLYGPGLSVGWKGNELPSGEIAGPATGFAPPTTGVDVAPGQVKLTYTGFDANVERQYTDIIWGYNVSCRPAAPVELATVTVSSQPGPPAVEALSDLQSPVAGGGTVRIQGRNFTGADTVSFGGVPATSFTVVKDGVIDVKVPARAAGSDVQVSVSRAGNASADTPADDFDFVGALAPGEFDARVPLVCKYTYFTPQEHTVVVRLRGKLPTNVQPGATFAATDVRTSVLFDGPTMAYGRDQARFPYLYLRPVELTLQGATSPTSKFGDGYLESAKRRVAYGEPVAFEGAFDKPWATPQPPNTITAAAPAGGAVTISLATARPILFGEYAGGGTLYGPQMDDCSIAPGADPVIARVPVGSAPVDQKPVVTKVSGVVFAGIGGVVAITGQRISGGTVKIGGRGAARIATVGSTVYVNAPALPAGTHDVVVTTSKGVSAVTAASKLRYPRLF